MMFLSSLQSWGPLHANQADVSWKLLLNLSQPAEVVSGQLGIHMRPHV